MFDKIVIAGGNGFLGKSLMTCFQSKAKQIVIISRVPIPESKNVVWKEWDGKTLGDWQNSLEGADAVINLAGKNVDCRYTEENKKQILESRLQSTRVLGEAIRGSKARPKVWLNASSATIYNASFDKMMTESTGEIGDDFSMGVCKQWEAQFNSFADVGIRQVAMRISIVLGWEGAALPALANLVKFGLGGRQGNGKQFCSWIHVEDFCRAVEWLITNPSATGAFNISAPHPIENADFMKNIRHALGYSLGLPSPQWLLEIGAIFLRTETELVLKSRKVYPERLLRGGFRFKHEKLENAMSDLASRRK